MAKTKTKKDIRIPKSTDCFVALFTKDGEIKGRGYCRQPIKIGKLIISMNVL